MSVQCDTSLIFLEISRRHCIIEYTAYCSKRKSKCGGPHKTSWPSESRRFCCTSQEAPQKRDHGSLVPRLSMIVLVPHDRKGRQSAPALLGASARLRNALPIAYLACRTSSRLDLVCLYRGSTLSRAIPGRDKALLCSVESCRVTFLRKSRACWLLFFSLFITAVIW